MSEHDQLGSNSARMTKEEITQRGFSTKVRGLSEADVRSFLKRVADEVERLGNREDELVARIKELETKLTEKPKVSKHELLENLGEQTARVLSSAEEAADQMVKEAKEEAARLSGEVKEKTQELLAASKAQAEEKLSESQARAKSLQESANRNAQTVIEEARSHGRELYQEAVVVREKILKDLLRRRDLLIEQIDELRIGREELLESYKVVKGSFQKATDALQSVEAKASNELMNNPIDVDTLLKAPVQLPEILDSANEIDPSVEIKASTPVVTISDEEIADVEDNAAEAKASDEENSSESQKQSKISRYMKDALGVGEDAPDVSSTVTPIKKEEAVQKPKATEAPEKLVEAPVEKEKSQKKDVGALFKSLKDQSTDKSDDKIAEVLIKSTSQEEVEAPKADTKKSAKAEKKSAKKDKQKSAIEIRDDIFAEVSSNVSRKAKRQLQDEQNEVLDALRTVKSKKRVSAESILISEETHAKAWSELLRSDLEAVFAAGAKTVSNESFTYSDEALHAAISWITTPLRDTITTAVDQGEQEDAATRVGSRYREWRNADLKNALFDAMSSAYNNGVVSGAKDGTLLAWKVEKAGQCPDCDDNSLEATSVGESFPTGQVAPPAHSGCKCVLTLA